MLISVFIPTYNQEGFIKDCVDGLLNQTYCDVEIVFSDDASSDGTWDELISYKVQLENKFSRVVFNKNEENIGIPANLNKMLHMSHGEWIKFTAGDDFFETDTLARFNDAILSSPDIDFWVSDGYVVEESATFRECNKTTRFYNRDISGLLYNNFVENLYTENFIFGASIAVRKSLYDKFGYYDESIRVDDWNQWLLFAINGAKFGYIDEPLVCYRKSSSSATSVVNSDMLEEKRKIIYNGKVYVLDKYKQFVSESLWAKQRLKAMFDECYIARNNKLITYHDGMLRQIRSFEGWDKLTRDSYKEYRCLYYKYIIRRLCRI